MDISNNNTITTTTATATTTTTAIVKNQEPDLESETPTRIQHVKPVNFTNGVLKRHPVVVIYKECLKNHAASLGGHAVDGCGEFMPSPATNPTDLKCAACGCHRNFHRREPEEPLQVVPTSLPALEYQPHHRHHPPPPPGSSSPNNSPSPPPISSAYYPASAPHMLLALSTGLSGPPVEPHSSNPNGRKRFRTKFTQDQKERMLEFAERVGWKMLKRDDDIITEFCNKVGVEKGVLKVWMHNNKNTFNKKDQNGNNNANAIGFAFVSRNHNNDNNNTTTDHVTTTTATTTADFHHLHLGSSNVNVATNGSSSSS